MTILTWVIRGAEIVLFAVFVLIVIGTLTYLNRPKSRRR